SASAGCGSGRTRSPALRSRSARTASPPQCSAAPPRASTATRNTGATGHGSRPTTGTSRPRIVRPSTSTRSWRASRNKIARAGARAIGGALLAAAEAVATPSSTGDGRDRRGTVHRNGENSPEAGPVVLQPHHASVHARYRGDEAEAEAGAG